MSLEFCRQSFEKYSNIKFHENWSSGSIPERYSYTILLFVIVIIISFIRWIVIFVRCFIIFIAIIIFINPLLIIVIILSIKILVSVIVIVTSFIIVIIYKLNFFFFAVAPRPNAGHGLLILDVSRSHTTTHHSL